MVHGPCSALDPHAPCMHDGKCIYSYPKPFQDHTTMDHDGHPHYVHLDDGHCYQVRNFMLNNHWIVPHNPYCMLWLQCHTNVECAICFASMKYISKYINKGGDCGTLTLHNHNNEVKQYIDSCYFSSMEAVWHILQFNLHGKSVNTNDLSYVTK